MVLAQDGTAIFVERSLSDNRVMWVDRAGRPEPVDPGGEPGSFGAPALSPDGRYLAGYVTNRSSDGSQIWVKDLSAGPWLQVTTGAGWRVSPTWSPDGGTIAYLTSEAGPYRLCALPSSGRSSADCEVLLDPDGSVMGAVYTRDGQGMVFQSGSRIGYLDLATGNVQEDLRPGESVGRDMALSPDGRWIAYTLNVTGGFEVYVSPFPDVASRTWRVSTDGGRFPLWAPDGRELFYRGGDRWVTVARYTADSIFTVEGRERLFDPGFSEGLFWRSWDVDPAGDRFVMTFPPPPGSTRWIQIQNLWTELEERAR
jgi:Tol biopolymer transport system component